MVILSKVRKPANVEYLNSLKGRFTNIGVLFSNFVGSEYFLESNSPVNLALCGTKLKDSTDSNNYSLGVIFL